MREGAGSGVTPEWALSGAAGRQRRVITSFDLRPERVAAMNDRLQAKIARMRAAEVRYDATLTEDTELLVVGFGTAGRIALTAAKAAREKGLRAGVFRPISL